VRGAARRVEALARGSRSTGRVERYAVEALGAKSVLELGKTERKKERERTILAGTYFRAVGGGPAARYARPEHLSLGSG